MPSLKEVAEAIRDTAVAADPDHLQGYIHQTQNPMVPAVIVLPELPVYDRHSMDGQHYGWWRVWVLVSSGDSEEEMELLYEYMDDIGDKSIPRQFKLPGAAWRSVSGLSDASWLGWARLDSSIQGPTWVSFGGGDYFGVALLIETRYG